MTWNSEVLDNMTVGVQTTTTEIAHKIAPNHPSYPWGSVVGKINHALREMEKYGIVKTSGMDKYGYRRLWERVM